jgi:cyclophilin family peptidyl-prolyl cis-trans isomerase
MGNPQVLCTTSMGEFTCEVYLDTMPITSSNFLDLVRTARNMRKPRKQRRLAKCRVVVLPLDWIGAQSFSHNAG